MRVAAALAVAALAFACQEPDMSMPVSRNRTYSPASQVASVDLNDLQDQVIALYALALEPATLVLPYASGDGRPMTGWDDDFLGYVESTAGAVWVIPIALDAGRQVTAVRVRVRRHTSSTVTATLQHATDGANTTVATVTSSTGAAADETLTLTPASPLEIEAGINRHYRIHLITTGSGIRIYQAEIDHEPIP